MIGRVRPGFIGIDSGPRAIAAVQLDAAGEIAAAGIVGRQPPTPDAPFSADEARALEEVLYRQGFAGRDIVIGVPDQLLLAEVLELPPRSSGAPIEQLARVEVARTTKRDPGSLELACWDIPAPPRAGDTTHVMAAACSHADADQLLDAFEGAGFCVRALDTRAWALARACRPFLGASSLGAVLDVGEHAALLALVHSGTVVYQRTMRDAGLGRLRARIREEIAVAPDVADYLLDMLGREAPADGRGPADGPQRDAAAMADEHVESLIAEVRTALEYAGHRYPSVVERMAVVGPGAGLSGLGRRLSAALKLTAQPAPPASVSSCRPALSAAGADPVLTTALGLAQWGRTAA